MQNELVGAVKSHASLLIEHLQRYGITLKKTQALEVVSHLQAQTDWNRVRAKLVATSDKPLQSPQMSSALASRLVPVRMLLGRPGIGKTEVLKTILNLECADRSAYPIFVCLSGSAHVSHGGYDNDLPRLDAWSIRYDANGITDIKRPLGLNGRGHQINFTSEIRGDRQGLKKAFVDFLIQNGSDLAADTVGTFMIDEFSRLLPEDEHDVISAAVAFCASLSRPVRRLLIASQTQLSQTRQINGAEIEYVVETGLHSFATHHPVQSVLHLYGFTAEPEWVSESIDDNRLIADIYARIMSMARDSSESDRFWGKESRRIDHIVGNSLWFRDFRNSLV